MDRRPNLRARGLLILLSTKGLLILSLLAAGLILLPGGIASAASLDWSAEVSPESTGGSAVRADALACPSTAQCTAVDTQGQENTFDPQQPAPPEPTTIDWGSALSGVACPSIAQCTAVDNHGGQFTFDPAAPAVVGTWPASAVSLFAVACASTTECVGVGNPQNTAVMFDPMGPPSSITLPIEQLDGLGAVSCPAASQCTATTLGSEITFDPAVPDNAALVPISSEGSIHAVACPTPTQCTAVEFDGQEITFNPSAPTGPKAIPIGISAPWGVACPSTEQCTAVGEFETSTFDPLDPERPPLLNGTGGGFASAIACPQLTQCTIVAGDEETTFDPQIEPKPSVAVEPNLPGQPKSRTTVISPGSGPGEASRIGLPRGTAVIVSRGRAVIPIRCSGDASCSIELALGSSPRAATVARTVGYPVPMGSAQRTIAGGKDAKVGIVLSGAGIRLLHAHHGRVSAQLVVNGRGGSVLIHASKSVQLRLTAHFK
jgi:hypothetical protein